MIPVVAEELKSDFVFAEQPTHTYQLHIDDNNIIGYTDDLEAMKQAIYLILCIERYQHIIYSWNYGVELVSLFGQPISYVVPELERRIREALIQDSRISDVTNFSFETGKRTVTATFTANTIFGDVEAQRTVTI